jgi:hypothetical protein
MGNLPTRSRGLQFNASLISKEARVNPVARRASTILV